LSWRALAIDGQKDEAETSGGQSSAKMIKPRQVDLEKTTKKSGLGLEFEIQSNLTVNLPELMRISTQFDDGYPRILTLFHFHD
jgi:hypothetical protein